jgi:hypothetical protein
MSRSAGENTGDQPYDRRHGDGPGPDPRPAGAGVPTLVRDLDLRDGFPSFSGDVVGRVLLLVRFGDVAVGRLVIPVPEEGLTGAQVGAAVAARFGSRPRRTVIGNGPAADRETRTRRHGGL